MDWFITDARSAFSLFDKKDTGSISIKDLGQVFRSCAMTVDSEQLSDWLEEMNVDGSKFHPARTYGIWGSLCNGSTKFYVIGTCNGPMGTPLLENIKNFKRFARASAF